MKLSLAALAAVAAAHPTFDAAEFRVVGRAQAHEEVGFTVALPQTNVDQLEALVAELSDPDHPSYGKWLDAADVNKLTAPLPEHREEVHEWVTSTGAKCEHMPASLACSARVDQLEKLLSTEFTSYEHVPRSNRLLHRIAPDTQYEAPTHLAGKMLFMTGLIDFPTVRMRMGQFRGMDSHSGRGLQNINWAATIETLSDLYSITPTTGNVNAVGCPTEFQNEPSVMDSDTALFATANGVPDWNLTTIVGPFQNGTADTESSLDWQFMGGVVAPTKANKQMFWTNSGWMYEWTQQVASMKNAQLPQVFSVSWGWSEAQQCWLEAGPGPCTTTNSSAAYVQAATAGFAAMAARGITIVVASGDSGAHGRTDGGCSATKLNPIFPGASPYVLTVGATEYYNATALTNPKTPYCQNPGSNPPCASGGVEGVSSTATGSLIVSGGGFSNVFSTPAWQLNAVQKYLKSGAIFAGAADFNATGRAYPDVAALGHNYAVYMYGSVGMVDGTSASTPVWAGLISLLNAQRFNAGKPQLGFVNPVLYKAAAMSKSFTDITIGDNKCTEQGCGTCTTGYGATVGFDAATGLGTPVFDNLKKFVATLP